MTAARIRHTDTRFFCARPQRIQHRARPPELLAHSKNIFRSKPLSISSFL